MNITFKRKAIFDNSPFSNKNALDERIGFWADVTEVNSEANTCNILSDTGFPFRNIPVATKEWITPKSVATETYTDRNYTTAERNLPPVGSRVFVLTPTKTIAGAFILCSGYTYGDKETHTLFEANKEGIRETKTQGGWTKQEFYKNGNVYLESNDSNIKLEINVADDTDNSKEKKLTLSAWNTEITITEEGLSVTLPEDLTINISGDANINVDGNTTLTTTKLSVNDGNLEVT